MNQLKFYSIIVLGLGLFFGWPNAGLAATLSISPATGVYSSGATFSVNVLVNTTGSAINAADGTLTFNPREINVVSVSRGSSIFNLWTSEPAFSNSAGTVTFSGGSPSGYTGSNGAVMTVTFRTLAAGSPKVSITGGSVLAADGRGTNVLTAMNGGTYTVSAVETQPQAEVIVEYVPPANTPATPVVKSTTHSDFSKWYKNTTAELTWGLPADVTAVRTLLDKNSSSVPTKVYDPAISELKLTDLEPGVSYLHLQFKNESGWGRVAHIRLAVDNQAPAGFNLSLAEKADLTSPEQIINASFDADEGSAIASYKIQLDGAEPFSVLPLPETAAIKLTDLKPGYHTMVVEAFDEAGNSAVSSLSFTILAFDKPEFTEYPTELSAGVIPVIKGQTKPNSNVEISFTSGSSEAKIYTVKSSDTGEFIFIPDQALSEGVYTLSAVAIDSLGARSEISTAIKIAVQRPGYLVIGTWLVNMLSIILSLLGLLLLFALGGWYVINRWRKLRGRVKLEASEALFMFEQEFAKIEKTVLAEAETLSETRKGKALTKGEQYLVERVQAVMTTAKARVIKEITDITNLVEPKK